MKKILLLTLLAIALFTKAQVPNMLKDITPGAGSTAFYWPYALPNNDVLFTAYSLSATALWVTDGSTAGTKKIRNNFSANYYTPYNSKIYYAAGNGQNALWRIDPTTEVIDSIPAPGLTSVRNFSVVNNTLVFLSNETITPTPGVKANVIWRSDGTSAGTFSISPKLEDIRTFTTINNIHYFSANTTSTGVELWRTDGTVAGTFMLSDIWPGSTGSIPGGGANPIVGIYNNLVFFVANNGMAGRELWKTDGTTAGTSIVMDIYTGSGDNTISQSSSYSGNNGLYFMASHPVSGTEFWYTDGTTANTQLIKDIVPGSGSANVSMPVFIGNSAYYSYGNTIYKSNGTSAGTSTISIDAAFSALSYTNSSRMIFSPFQVHNGEVYFVIRKEMSSSFPTADSLIFTKVNQSLSSVTPILKALVPQGISFLPGKVYMYKVGDNFIYTFQYNTYLGIFDIVTGNARIFSQLGLSAQNNISARFAMPQIGSNKLYFPCTQGGYNPAYIDLVTDSIKVVKNISNGMGFYCGSFTMDFMGRLLYKLNAKHYFLANESNYGVEFFETDFTPAGTFRVKDIYPGGTSFDNNFWNCVHGETIIQTANNIYFFADDGVNGLELWSFINAPNNPGGGIGLEDRPELGKPVVYPNPTEGIFKIESPAPILEVIVHNMLGSVVWQQKQNGAVLVSEINLGSVNAGVNLVTVKTTSGSYTQRLLKN